MKNSLRKTRTQDCVDSAFWAICSAAGAPGADWAASGSGPGSCRRALRVAPALARAAAR